MTNSKKPVMIDEREVYEFLDILAGCSNEADLLFNDEYKTLSEFFEKEADVKGKLFELWRNVKGSFERELYPLTEYDCEVESKV